MLLASCTLVLLSRLLYIILHLKAAHDYAKKKGISNDAAANLFFGVFFFFFQSGTTAKNALHFIESCLRWSGCAYIFLMLAFPFLIENTTPKNAYFD